MELSPYVLMWVGFIMGVSLLISYNMLHVLNCLIFLELLVLFNFWLMMTSLSGGWPPFIMAYFVVTVASAALGLSILISVCRSHGQDYLFKYNITF